MLNPTRIKQLDLGIKEILAKGGTRQDVERYNNDFLEMFSEPEPEKKQPPVLTAVKKKEVAPLTGPLKNQPGGSGTLSKSTIAAAQKRSASSASKRAEGVYSYPNSKNLYRKVGNNWEIKTNGVGKYTPIKSATSVANLEKNTKQLYGHMDEYVKPAKFEDLSPKETVKGPAPTASEKAAQLAFDKMKILGEKDPIVIAKNKADEKIRLERDALEKNISSINGDLIGQGQAEVVAALQKKFPNFTFGARGTFTDEMTVTAPNNQTIHISLDNILSSDDSARALELRNWMSVNSNKELAAATKKLDVLEYKNQGTRFARPGDIEYVKDSPYGQPLVPDTQETVLEKLGVKNLVKEAEKVVVRKELAKQQVNTFEQVQYDIINKNLSQSETTARLAAVPHDKETSKRMNEYSNDVLKISKDNNSKIEQLNIYSEDILKKLNSGEITQEQYDLEYKPKLEADIESINKQTELLKGELSNISSINRSINVSTAKNYLIEESKGTVIGGVMHKLLTGATYLPRLMSGGAVTAQDQKDLVDLIAGKGTTDEYMNSENRSDLTKALFSLSESLGAMASGGGIGGATAKMIGGKVGALVGGSVPFYGQSYYNMKDEFDQIEGMSETEKVLMSTLYGVGSAILEKFGLDFALGKTGLGKNITNSIMKSAFSSIPKNATKEMIEIAIEDSAKKLLARAGLKSLGAGVGEGSTEIIQAGFEAGIKESYDAIKKTEYFNNKLDEDGNPMNMTAWDITKGALYEGYLGALGGNIMNIASQSGSAIKNGLYKTYNEEQIQALITASNVEGVNDSILASLKTNILSGQITKDEAKEVLSSFGKIQSIAKTIPADLTDLQKSASLNLLIRKSALENEIEGKDKLLVKDKIDRISKINEELLTIKTTENAVKESKQESIPVEGGTTEYQGVSEGQQKVGESQGVERNATPNEANISDSNLPSQEEKVTRLAELETKLAEDVAKKGKGKVLDIFERNNLEQEIASLKPAEETVSKEQEQQPKEVMPGVNLGFQPEVAQEQQPVSEDLKDTDSTAKALEALPTDDKGFVEGIPISNLGLKGEMTWDNKSPQSISEAYHEAKTNDSNPELVNAVESLLQKEVAPEVAQESTFEEAKSLDPKDKLYSKKIYDILENQKQALIKFSKESSSSFIIPPQVLIKVIEGLQAATNLGMTFEQALRDYAAKNNMKVEDIENSLYASSEVQKRQTRERISSQKQPAVTKSAESIEAKNIAKKTITKITVNEATALKTQIKLEAKAAAEGAKSVVESRKEITKHFNSLSEKNKLSRDDLNKVIKLITKVKDSKSLNDAIPNLFKIMDNAKSNIIEVNEAAALKDQIRLEVKAAAAGYKAGKAEGKAKAKTLKENRNNLRETVKTILKVGKISSKKVGYMMDRFGTVNVNSPKAVEKYLNYVEKIFNDAEYEVNLSQSLNIRKKIRAALKSGVAEDIQADVKIMAKSFLDINPISLDSFGEYNDIATEVLNSVKRFEGVGRIAPPIKEINNYVEGIKAEQEKNATIDRLSQYDNLVELGIIEKGMSLKEMNDIISSIESTEDLTSKEEIAKEKADNIKKYVSELFNGYSDTISYLLSTDNEYSPREKDVMSRVLNLNIDAVKNIKDAYRFVEGMGNFIENGIISGLEAKLNAAEGNIEIEEASNDKTLAQGRTDQLQRVRLEYMSSLDILFEELFGGVTGALKVSKALGINLMSKGSTIATKTHDKIVDDYVSAFHKKKPNNKEFNTNENDFERGLISRLKRNVIGTELEKQNEFKNRLNIILNSIKDLEQGSKEEKQLAEDYSKLVDKFDLNNPNITIDDILSKADPINVEAVNWWTDKWGEYWNELSDVSKSVNNLILTKEENYTPDNNTALTKNKKVKTERELDKIGSFQTALGIDTNTSGATMEKIEGLKSLSNRYANLSFDNNNSRSIKAALLDINTAAISHKMNAAIRNDEALTKLIPDPLLREIFKNRVIQYQRLTKSKTMESDVDLAKLASLGNKLGSIGASKVLGSVGQVIQQSAPVITNTIVNTGSFDLRSAFSSAANKFLDESGMAISIRGQEASTSLDNIDKRLNHYERTLKSFPLKALKWTNEVYLKQLLVRTDVYVARASWLAYYEKKLGYRPDYKTHELDQDAADYAQHMVNRNQNITETAKGGKFLASKEPVYKIIKQTAFTFASFSLNQKNRMVADIKILSRKTATAENRRAAFVSIMATLAEMVLFQGAKIAIGMAVTKLAYAYLGEDEPEEESEKRFNKLLSYGVSNAVKDLFSPLPTLDPLVVSTFNMIADSYQNLMIKDSDVQAAVDAENAKLLAKDPDSKGMDTIDEKNFRKEYIASQKMVFEQYENKPFLGLDLGAAGIVIDQAKNLYDLRQTQKTGIIIKDYNGEKIESYVSPEDKDLISEMLAVKATFLILGLPKEINDISNLIIKVVSKRSMNERENEKYLKVKELYPDEKISTWEDKFIRSTSKLKSVIEKIEEIKKYGGLTEEETKVYFEVKDRIKSGDVSIPNLKRIKEGKDADYIINKKYVKDEAGGYQEGGEYQEGGNYQEGGDYQEGGEYIEG